VRFAITTSVTHLASLRMQVNTDDDQDDIHTIRGIRGDVTILFAGLHPGCRSHSVSCCWPALIGHGSTDASRAQPASRALCSQMTDDGLAGVILSAVNASQLAIPQGGKAPT
jgi:hypothetical protein